MSNENVNSGKAAMRYPAEHITAVSVSELIIKFEEWKRKNEVEDEEYGGATGVVCETCKREAVFIHKAT